MEIRDIINNWESCGQKNITSFSLKPHYTILFDAEDDGFDYIYQKIGVDKDTLINSDNQTVKELLIQADDLMHETSSLIENFIKDNVLLNETEFEDVVVEYSHLTKDVMNIYDQICDQFSLIKYEFECVDHVIDIAE